MLLSKPEIFIENLENPQSKRVLESLPTCSHKNDAQPPITGHWWLEVCSSGSWSDSPLDIHVCLHSGHLRHHPRSPESVRQEDAARCPRLQDREAAATARARGASSPDTHRVLLTVVNTRLPPPWLHCVYVEITEYRFLLYYKKMLAYPICFPHKGK